MNKRKNNFPQLGPPSSSLGPLFSNSRSTQPGVRSAASTIPFSAHLYPGCRCLWGQLVRTFFSPCGLRNNPDRATRATTNHRRTSRGSHSWIANSGFPTDSTLGI